MGAERHLREMLGGQKSAADMLRAYNAGEVDENGNDVPAEEPRPGRRPDYSQGVGASGASPRHTGGLNGRGPLDSIAESLRAGDPGADITINNSPSG